MKWLKASYVQQPFWNLWARQDWAWFGWQETCEVGEAKTRKTQAIPQWLQAVTDKPLFTHQPYLSENGLAVFINYFKQFKGKQIYTLLFWEFIFSSSSRPRCIWLCHHEGSLSCAQNCPYRGISLNFPPPERRRKKLS